MAHLQRLVNIAGRNVLIIGWLLSMVSISLAQGDTWTTKAPMPTATAFCSAAEVNGIIYVTGGITPQSGLTGVSNVYAYDPTTDTWAKKADMPGGRAAHAACASNGKIYVIGGVSRIGGPAISVVEEYDPATDSWTRKADMPTARTHFGWGAVNGKIYAIGGSTGPSNGLSTVEAYDPATNTWSTKADMPTARTYLAASVENGKIYAIGGALSHSGPMANVEEYNPATNEWTPKRRMQIGRLGLSTTASNGKFYAIGGAFIDYCCGPAATLAYIEEYDTVTDTWTVKSDMPTARAWLATSAVNGKIYAIGGTTIQSVVGIVATMEEYTPETVTSIEDKAADVPTSFVLHQNYPNPLNPSTVISYELSAASEVELTIYNPLGQKVKTLVNEKQSAGVYQVQWDGKSEDGVQLSSGVYIYRIKAGDFMDAKKLALIR